METRIQVPEVSLDPSMEIARDFSSQLKLSHGVYDEIENGCDDVSDEDGDVSDEEEFSFVCPGDDAAQIAAEDAFFNGQIRPVYPLFNRDLLLGGGDLEGLSERLPVNPPVRNVFVETTSYSPGNEDGDDAEGPSCEWSGKAVKAAADGPDGCRKSNSTGFSKFWRFRDLLHRSNSDGRDAFVFLNNPAPSTSAAAKTEERKNTGEVKVNGNIIATQKKKSKKQVSAHERYMKSKAKDEDRRRSYLPYRPELVGFFTNVKGGLTRNVHPF